ncbi:MAG: hypothetical protein KAX09_03650 [Candidatus Heimdallarchaeota archaeon]|nr:hypothetical protein [Candidatus Heimdallarchaeota archaeon]MCK4290055.1 hypothetical protein [Candidatus Heimdallarchaeota archaeon]
MKERKNNVSLERKMAASTKKVGVVITVIVISSMIIVGTGIGIWLGVRSNLHPDPGWTLKITGNIRGGNTTITMSEIINMPAYKAVYEIRAKTNVNYTFQGAILANLFQDVINIDPSAENVTFIAVDEYQWTFPIIEIQNNNTYILAYLQNNQYLDSFDDGGNGYLWLIVPNYDENDFNGQRCVKNTIEIHFE